MTEDDMIERQRRSDYLVRVRRLARYGLTPDDAIALMEAQGFVCPMCGRPLASVFVPARGLSWVIDHDHTTGAVRGFLCAPCNRQIGFLHENVTWLQNAADYLRRPPATRVFDEPRLHENAPPADRKDD